MTRSALLAAVVAASPLAAVAQTMSMPMPVPATMAGMTMTATDVFYQDGSGTARLPADEGEMTGAMFNAGDWSLMMHGYAWAVATHQAGPRGDDGRFIESMAMLTADHAIGVRTRLQLRGMMSLEPALGPRGYPDLFATGETAHGVPLVDRQHPHDLFMELSARVDRDVSRSLTLFAYGGPVAEPALGPSAFMHRRSAELLPLAPITHHWFDSTHITYGVVTLGAGTPRWQVEASAFRGREPDEHRWNIERPSLDSWSVRATWTPSAHWALEASHGFLKSPEAQASAENERRTIASAQWSDRRVSTTIAWSAKQRDRTLTAWLAEADWRVDRHHTLFGRAENVDNDELFPNVADPLHGRAFRVTKVEGGYAYRLHLLGPLGAALGGTVAGYAKPAALDTYYGHAPVSWTLFGKLQLGM